MSALCIEHVVRERITRSCYSLYTILSDLVSRCVSIYLQYDISLCVCHDVLSVLSKGLYKYPSVERIATGSVYIDYMCCYPSFVSGSIAFEFWWSSGSITAKIEV